MEELTPESLAASEILLELKPHFAEGHDRLERVRSYAQFYMSVGKDRFDLLMGLRLPLDAIEAADLKFHAGRITALDHRHAWETHTRRPVDARMLRLFYEGLEQQIVGYGRVIGGAMAQAELLRSKRVFGWDEAALQIDFAAAIATWSISAEELMAVDAFAMEARTERNLSCEAFGDRNIRTVAHYYGIVAQSLLVARVDPAGAGRIGPGTLPRVIAASARGQLPEAGRLQSLMHEEYTAARLVLQTRTAAAAPLNLNAAHVQIAASTCAVDAGVALINAGTTNAAPCPGGASGAPAARRFKIERWSQLRIGIDESRVLAFAPPPRIGETVVLSRGVPLDLTGDRWQFLFDLASRAGDGRMISQIEFIQRCRLLSAPKPRRTDATPKVKRGRSPHEITKADSAYVASILSKFRSALERQIDGPAADAQSVLVRNASDVDLGFVIQAILGDGEGHYTFGPAIR